VTTRTAFLSTLRQRLAGGIPDNPVRPLTLLEGPPPPIAYTADLSDLPAAFTAAAEVAGATVRRMQAGDAAGFVAEVCAGAQVQRAAVSDDPECAGLADGLRAAGIEVTPPDHHADIGITGALAGIALTGTLVVDNARAGSRAVSVLPPVHLALLPMASLVPTPGDVLRGLTVDSLPSNLVFITGPSRSADIELYLARGVHGPGQVWIGLLDYC
jgi:L-lactate dehydrogenase complex protein LldG